LTVEENLREDLSEYREALKLGVPLCDFCNSLRVTKHLCAGCDACARKDVDEAWRYASKRGAANEIIAAIKAKETP